MERRRIGSMKDFAYFKKLKNTKKNDPIFFFNSPLFNYYITKIKKKEQNQPFDDLFINSYNTPFPEEVLINELKKPVFISNEISISTSLSKKDLNTKLKNKNNKEIRNIEIMLMSLKKNKNCVRYLKNNLFTDDQIRLLLSIAKTNHYQKDEIIYLANTRPTKFFMVLKGKVAIKTLIPEKIKEYSVKNSTKFEKIYENFIKAQESENFLENVDVRDIADGISESSFVSKDNLNIILNEFNKKKILNDYNKNNNDINNYIIKKPNNKHKRSSSNIIFSKVPNRNKNIINFNSPFITPTKNQIHRTSLNVISKPQKNNDILIEEYMNKLNILKLQNKLGYVTNIYNPGIFFGERELINEKPYKDSAYAVTETDLLIIDKVNFDKYISKQISFADLTRRNFLVRYIPFLQPQQLVNAHPEFHDKDEIIYTQYDKAEEFFLIYQGCGILKKVNNNKFKCNKKGDIINNINDLDTVCFIDKGCLVGLESYKHGKYENNFIIMEDNTILFRFPLKNYYKINFQYFKYEHALDKGLKNLYVKHRNFITKFQNYTKNLHDDIKNKISEDHHQITEEKCNDIFNNAKEYKVKKSSFPKDNKINRTQVLNVVSDSKRGSLFNKLKQKHNSSKLNELFNKNMSIKLRNNDLINNKYNSQNLNNNIELCHKNFNNSFLENKCTKTPPINNKINNPLNKLQKNTNKDLCFSYNKLNNIILNN